MPKSKSFSILVLLILLCLAAPISSARAETEAVATVVALRGTVVAQGKSGASRNLSLKSQLFQEDVLKTGKDSQLQIMFTDNSIIRLGRDSEMKIVEYRWQPEQKDGALRTQVKEGTFRVMGGALAKNAPQNFKTETPTATIGIRGSMYAFRSTLDSLSVVFQGGRGIEIFNDHGRVTITTPGFGTQVLLNAPPARPSRFTDQNLNNLNRDFNGEGGNGGDGSTGGGGSDTPTPLLVESDPTPAPAVTPILPPANELPSAPGANLSQAPPSDGIFTYGGGLVGYAIKSNEETEIINENLSLGINWYNRRIFGIIYGNAGQDDKPAFFFGSTNGALVSDLTIFGTDYNYNYATNDPKFISGSGYGAFTGTAYDFFSFAARGSTYLILDSTIHENWVVTGAGQQVTDLTNSTTVPRGTDTWKGFATGISVDLDSLYPYPPKLFQSSADDFTLTVNKDAGTLNGTLSLGYELNASYPYGEEIVELQLGGTTSNSVYVRDDLMAALITEGDGSPDLKPYGNFMVVAGPTEQFSTYVTWGYWQIAYTEANESERIIATPHSLWIAGRPSTDSVIRPGFTGSYSGGARGSKLEASGAATYLTGTCNLTANFDAANPITSGNITFPGYVTLAVNSASSSITASSTSNSFAAAISGGGTAGSLKGAFFGPAANAIGGNFYSSGGGVQYLGIFGGNKQ
ncbi:MAG: hypothetical protein A2505_07625 [Deltaproteobacteria bacterium RIFOXYD12_FULL_55_16]|nr:MAG: hypothetical protein A2505_07625 [Deltaproteobacteria bacterium RIFOXYD12_FULL_55_16]